MKKRLSPQEIGVAERLREARGRLNLSQGEAARQLGITRERLASYEDGRTPIRFELALRFCWQFIFSEEWLALGEKEIINRADKRDPGRHIWEPSWARYCMSLYLDPIVHKIGPGTPFLKAFEVYLEPIYDSLRKGQFMPRVMVAGVVDNDQVGNYLHALMEIWMGFFGEPFERLRFLSSMDFEAQRVYAAIREGYLSEQEEKHIMLEGWESGAIPESINEGSKEMAKFIESERPKFLAKFSARLAGRLPEHKKNPIDDIPKHGNNEVVKARLPELIKRLNTATRERGKKAALARFLKVPLPKVSQWLSGAHSPGGETTLQLLQWVEQEERQ